MKKPPSKYKYVSCILFFSDVPAKEIFKNKLPKTCLSFNMSSALNLKNYGWKEMCKIIWQTAFGFALEREKEE